MSPVGLNQTWHLRSEKRDFFWSYQLAIKAYHLHMKKALRVAVETILKTVWFPIKTRIKIPARYQICFLR